MTLDSEAAEVCRRLHPRLVGALGLYCGDLELGEDLAQEALVRLWERWPTARRPDDPMAWCYRVGVNLARSAARRRALEQRVLRRALSIRPTAGEAEEPTARALAVRAAVRNLPTRQRQAVVARHYLGLSVRETAAAMACAPGTVTALTAQAVANLRRARELATTDWNEEVEHGNA